MNRPVPISVEAVRLAELAVAGPLLYVAEDDARAEALGRFLIAVLPRVAVEIFPAWDCLPYDLASPSPYVVGRRMAILQRLDKEGVRGVVVTSAAAAVQRIPPPRMAGNHEITVGRELDADALDLYLRRAGYVFDARVDEPGEAAFQGGVVEVYPAGADMPCRIEVDGTLVTGIRRYDPASQRSVDEVETLSIAPVSELPPDQCEATEPGAEHQLAGAWGGRLRTLFDACKGAQLVMSSAAEASLTGLVGQIREAEEERRRQGHSVPEARALYVVDDWPSHAVDLPPPFEPVPNFATEARPQAKLTALLRGEREAGRRVVFVAATARDLDRLSSAATRALGETVATVASWADVMASGGTVSILAPLDLGYVDLERKISVVTAADLFGSRVTQAGNASNRVAPLEGIAAEFHLGDRVVHLDHGVANLEGLEEIEGSEVLRLVYDQQQTLMVPAAEAGMIWRYGSAESGVALDRIGTGRWRQRREKIAAAMAETARALIAATEARRASSTSRLTPPQDAYERLAIRFPYRLTPDQAQAARDVLADLASGIPMDRLVVGDVGFGKTEVALRAAAAVALSGRQVAVVAPTTVLARQHARTFARRFQGSGLAVGHLSRLVPAPEARRVRAGLKDGSIRVVVGTHALLGDGVAFDDLGLIIVDEEQRFGAAHKAKLRAPGHDLHMLSMTATPIPRTLQSALVGLRDLSTLYSPPANRRPVRTFVAPFDATLIRQALLRERRRGGQSFLVVPQVGDIERTAALLSRVVPDLAVMVAHGQMPPRDIDEAMVGFAEGRGDILLATSIIESGLDVPRANTMVVLRPELFGLAQLHQLRGRVGRGNLQAYCFLASEPGEDLSAAAVRRLGTLQALDRLGAGMAISAQDLDQRGAGDMFGEKQAGHVKLIGLALYQELLASALREARGEKVISDTALQLGSYGSLPVDYIPEEEARINLYHRLARARDPAEVRALSDEITDRFGPPVPLVQELIGIARIRALGRSLGITRISAGPDAVAFTFSAETDVEREFAEVMERLSPDLQWDGERLIWRKPLQSAEDQVARLLDLLEALL